MSQNSIQENEFEQEEFFNSNNLSNNNNVNNSISNFNNRTNNINNNYDNENDNENNNDNENENDNYTNNQKQNFKILNSESNASAVNNIVKSNKIFLEKGIDSAFKNLTSNLFSTINSTFANYNNNFEKKVY
jgi:hypothetical protein